MKTVVYFIGEYPKLANAFVQTQILELKRRGFRVLMYSLNEPTKPVSQDDYKADGVVYMKKESNLLKILSAHIGCLVCHPIKYFGILGDVISGGIYWKIFFRFLWVVQSVKKENPDYMHCYFAEAQAVVGMMVERILEVPYTFQIGGTGSMLKSHKQLLCMVKNVSRTVVVSRDMEEKILNLDPRVEKGRIAFNTAGIDMTQFKVQGAQGERKANTILFVGRQVKHKGVQFLIESLKTLKEQGCVYSAKIIGEGDDWEEFKALAKKYELNDVEFLGSIPNEEVADYMQEAAIFAFPSLFEGSPIVLMEAMACGCALVSTKVNGIPDMITDDENGFLIEPENVDQLTAGLKDLLDHPEKVKAMSAASLKRSKEYDIVDQMGKLVLEWETIENEV